MPYSTYTTLGLGDLIPTKLIVELVDKTVKRPKGIVENVLVGIDKFTFPVDFIILDIPEDFKTPLILGRPFLSTAHAIINVFKAKITLSIRNDKFFFKKARLMGNTLRKDRSHDPKFKDYIELSDLNEPLELRHDQVVDLGPTIEEGEVTDTPIKEIVKTRHNDKITNGIEDYPSFSDFNRKIHVTDAYNLRFFCMIVIEDMDRYSDEEMGDVIVRKEFCKEIGVKAIQFERTITIYNGNDEMTYQMARLHSRFKHLTNEQCNKIPPLLKMSEEDKINGISHSYQKLKRFYKGVLNLGLSFIKDLLMKEWLTRGHVSVHEMEWTLLKEKKSTMLVENLRSGNFEVLES
ncbi:gag-pol polyprotein [Tanacetum coccineum]